MNAWSLERKPRSLTVQPPRPAAIPPIVSEVLGKPGRPLSPEVRAPLESRFGHDFSRVRVHDDARAAESARAVNARAFTVGTDVAFGDGEYAPRSTAGQRLLAHELAHVVQQSRQPATRNPAVLPVEHPSEAEADRAAGAALGGGRATVTPTPVAVQRQGFREPSPVSVRSPVFEETVTQLTDLNAAISGRRLTLAETALAQGVFGNSIDFSRVRLIPTNVLEYRTVGNTTRVPRDFTIKDPEMAQTFIHEMTHVWQYQQGGTSYLSVSLATQIVAQAAHGNRNFAYAYTIAPRSSFFDFTPEQQALIVENYFAMLRDRTAIPADQAAGRTVTYNSNHFDASGFPSQLSGADRLAEIARELPDHERLIHQMQAALPRSQADIMMIRASDVMQIPNQALAPVPPERQLTPVRPLLELRFPGL